MKTLMIAAVTAAMALPASHALASGQSAVTLPSSARPTGAAEARPAAEAPSPASADSGKALVSLRNTIVALTNEQVDYTTMTAQVATKVREQTDQITPLLRQFGPLKNAQALGIENGAEKFRVNFENQTTEWLIGFDDEDKIAILLFRPIDG